MPEGNQAETSIQWPSGDAQGREELHLPLREAVHPSPKSSSP